MLRPQNPYQTPLKVRNPAIRLNQVLHHIHINRMLEAVRFPHGSLIACSSKIWFNVDNDTNAIMKRRYIQASLAEVEAAVGDVYRAITTG